LLAASTLLALVAAEIVLRLVGPPYPSELPIELPEELRDLPTLRTVAELVKPGVRGVYQGALYESNAEGFRDREYQRPKPPGTFRIVVIGDSFTMGNGVAVEDAYPSQLERMLAARDDGLRYEVLNLGLAGANLERSVAQRLVAIGLDYDPDLIVYGSTPNDIEGPSYRKSARFDPLWYGWARPKLLLWGLVQTRWLHLMEMIRPPAGSYVAELDDNYFHNQQAWQYFVGSMDHLADVARERDLCVIVLVHTRLDTLNGLHPFRRHYEAIASAARAEGFTVVQSFPYFRGMDAGSLWAGPRNPHPNPQAHRILAQALYDSLDELPSQCWQHGQGDSGDAGN